MKHITVLQREAIEALALNPQSVVIDATYGAGGHATAIMTRLGKQGKYLGIDIDATALKVGPPPGVAEAVLVQGNFRAIETIATDRHLTPTAILADLGWRTDQFTDGGKGLSFAADEPLVMTFGNPAEYAFTAHDIVNEWAEEALADIFYGYADERYARRYAKAIMAARLNGVIASARELADIIVSATPRRPGPPPRIHPATKVFQALRIAVNDELGALEDFIMGAVAVLAPEGRLAIISFHSIEDRIVKQRFRSLAETDEFRILTKRPITASPEEIAVNPRARSAKLRIISKQ